MTRRIIPLLAQLALNAALGLLVVVLLNAVRP